MNLRTPRPERGALPEFGAQNSLRSGHRVCRRASVLAPLSLVTAQIRQFLVCQSGKPCRHTWRGPGSQFILPPRRGERHSPLPPTDLQISKKPPLVKRLYRRRVLVGAPEVNRKEHSALVYGNRNPWSRDAQSLCGAQIIVDTFMNWAGNGWSGAGRLRKRRSSMGRRDVSSSGLPSLLLPCPLCGHRMAIASVTPARLANGAEANDLEDITHTCVHCGTAVIRTIRLIYGDDAAIIHRP